MLEVRNVSKTYRSIPAVQDVSFALRAGEILGYLGPNGSGESTTVKMVTGLIQPSGGKVLFGGLPPLKLQKSGLSMSSALLHIFA